jgi:hypothetical protein
MLQSLDATWMDQDGLSGTDRAPRRFDYGEALQNELIEFIPQSQGLPIKTFRGLAVLLGDNLSPAAGIYTTIFDGAGAVGLAVTPPRTGFGAELFRIPGAGNGGGQNVLHSWNMAIRRRLLTWLRLPIGIALSHNANPYRSLSLYRSSIKFPVEQTGGELPAIASLSFGVVMGAPRKNAPKNALSN